MQIFTIHDLLSILPTVLHTLGIMKDAIVGAIFTNLYQGFFEIFHSNLGGALGIIGGLVLLWRLKLWLPGFALHSLIR